MQRTKSRLWMRAFLCLSVAFGALAPMDGMAQWRGSGERFLRRFRPRIPDKNERNHPLVKEAFKEVTASTMPSTVRVLADGIQIAMGTIVTPDGYILTKASELDGKLECYFHDGRRLEAKQVSVHAESDLALLHVNATGLPAVDWVGDDGLPIGSWLISTSVDETPTAIGVVSAAPREIPNPRAVLGIHLDTGPEGARVESVISDSAAAKAGLRPGDVILEMDGTKLADRDALIKAIGNHTAGDRVTLSVLRNGKTRSIPATLGAYSHLGNQQQADLMDSLGGPLSHRRYGFPTVMQHDSVLRPRDCGGPVVNLEGEVVGINIARASRVASYALPVRYVRKVLDELLHDQLTEVARSDASE